MAFSSRVKTHPGIATLIAFVLVAIFGSPAYANWADKHGTSNAGDLFLHTLAWPRWTFSTNSSIRTLVADDLRAVLVVVLTYIFVALLAPAATGGLKGAIGRLLAGWGGFIFAGAFAGLINALIVANTSFLRALEGAVGGGTYGLLIGWVVGLVSLAA
jgi:hypothetical protein